MSVRSLNFISRNFERDRTEFNRQLRLPTLQGGDWIVFHLCRVATSIARKIEGKHIGERPPITLH